MPTTGLSLFLFVVLLAPGFAYLNRIEKRLPGETYTTLREVAVVATRSLMSEGLVLGAVFVVDTVFDSGVREEFESFASTPAAYHSLHPAAVWGWTAVIVGAATAVATVMAVPPRWVPARLPKRVPPPVAQSRLFRWLGDLLRPWMRRRVLQPITSNSGWVEAFTQKPDCDVWVGLRLVDGVYLRGPLGPYSTQTDENADRSLQLVRPITMRTAKPGAVLESLDADVVIVSAGQIKTIAVHYVDPVP